VRVLALEMKRNNVDNDIHILDNGSWIVYGAEVENAPPPGGELTEWPGRDAVQAPHLAFRRNVLTHESGHDIETTRRLLMMRGLR